MQNRYIHNLVYTYIFASESVRNKPRVCFIYIIYKERKYTRYTLNN